MPRLAIVEGGRMGEVPLVPQVEFQRQPLSRAVDVCVRAWSAAREDSAALGFPSVTSGRDGVSGKGTCTDGGPTARLGSEWAENPDPSVAWLSELFDVVDAFAGGAVWVSMPEVWVAAHWHVWVDDYADRFPVGRKDRAVWEVLPRRLIRLANAARVHWPPLASRGSVVGGVTVGERGNSMTVCDLCGEPIAGTHVDPVRHVPDALGGHKNLHRSPCWYTWTMDQGVHPRQLRVVEDCSEDDPEGGDA